MEWSNRQLQRFCQNTSYNEGMGFQPSTSRPALFGSD